MAGVVLDGECFEEKDMPDYTVIRQRTNEGARAHSGADTALT